MNDEQELCEELDRLRYILANIHMNTNDAEELTLEQARYKINIIRALVNTPNPNTIEESC